MFLSSLFPRKTPPSPDPPDAIASSREARRALEVTDGPLAELHTGRTFRYSGSARSGLYRFLRDHIPIVSSGVWTWVRLCTTPQRLELTGPEAEVLRAQPVVEALQQRIYPRRDGDAHGLERLTESLFLELFTLGRIALRVHLFPDASGISHLELLDPDRLRWRRSGSAPPAMYLEDDEGRLEPLSPATTFHRTLTADLQQPHGVEPLASIPFVVEIEQKMLEDMARSSHNAGTPRLQIRLAPPERHHGEDEETYTNRINRYFDATVRQFRELNADDNVFTWSDVEVEVVGGPSGHSTAWKLNREQVIEDVITGLKLFPWALGRSHGTTKNWIYAQYNLLMQIVDSVQRLGADLAEWLIRLELRLAGNRAAPRWHFSPNQDPFIEERNRARLLELERVERLVAGGFISRDQGARELGYDRAHRTDSASDPSPR